MVHAEIGTVNTDVTPTSLGPAMHGQLMRLVRKALLHDATIVPNPTYCTLPRSPRGFTRSSPTLAAPPNKLRIWDVSPRAQPYPDICQRTVHVGAYLESCDKTAAPAP